MHRNVWMWIGALGVFVASVLTVASIVADPGPSAENLRGIDEANALTREIPQEGMTIGDPAAPVHVVEYLDVACPACARASETIGRELIGGPVRDGQVRLTIRPLALLHPRTSERGALAIHAAGSQGAAWQFATILLANQGASGADWLTDEILTAVAARTGLDVDAWAQEYAGAGAAAGLRADRDASRVDRLAATPTFVISGRGGRQVLEGVPAMDDLRAAIRAVA